MGLLRLWLAFIVLVDHIAPDSAWRPLDGQLAIQGFYILSGFFIQYVLNDHYKGVLAGSYKKFYLSRALRIFPSFYVILLASTVFTLVFLGAPRDNNTAFFSVLSHANLPHAAYYIVSQLFIFGSSFTRFMSFNDTLGIFYPMTLRIGGTLHIPGAGSTLLVPQMWSLELELIFYLLAPLLLRLKDTKLVLLFAASMLVRMWADANGLYLRSYNNDFFPAELGIFLLGAFAARFYIRYLKDAAYDCRFIGHMALAGLIAYSFAYPHWNAAWIAKNWIFLTLVTASVSVIFKATGNSKTDRWIGDLAYPVYLSHYLALGLARVMGLPTVLGAYALTLVLSVTLLLLVERPVHKFRQKRFYQYAPPNENPAHRLEPAGQPVAA